MSTKTTLGMSNVSHIYFDLHAPAGFIVIDSPVTNMKTKITHEYKVEDLDSAYELLGKSICSVGVFDEFSLAVIEARNKLIERGFIK